MHTEESYHVSSKARTTSTRTLTQSESLCQCRDNCVGTFQQRSDLLGQGKGNSQAETAWIKDSGEHFEVKVSLVPRPGLGTGDHYT